MHFLLSNIGFSCYPQFAKRVEEQQNHGNPSVQQKSSLCFCIEQKYANRTRQGLEVSRHYVNPVPAQHVWNKLSNMDFWKRIHQVQRETYVTGGTKGLCKYISKCGFNQQTHTNFV